MKMILRTLSAILALLTVIGRAGLVVETLDVRENIIITARTADINTTSAKLTNPPGDIYDERLPKTSRPIRYWVHLTTYIHRGIYEYKGNCSIDIVLQEDTHTLILHADGSLKVERISVRALNDSTMLKSTCDLIYEQDRDWLIIKYDATTKEQPSESCVFRQHQHLHVEILYSAAILKGSAGFHELTYVGNYNQRILAGASTQFQPSFARTAIPCYDEPEFKANFSVSITHGGNFTAIANMPAVGEPIESSIAGMVTTTFMDTPPMSTYLLAFAIFDYANVSAVGTDGTVHRIFYPPNSPGDFHLAVNKAILALDTLAQFMGIPFMLPKLDHLIAHEHYARAMENWGLITYKDIQFPYGYESDIQHRYRLVNNQLHELAHQWFGDLVSPKWWDNTWLNEAFATYYSHLLSELIYPEYESIDNFNINSCFNAVRSNFTTPITDPTVRPSDAVMTFGFMSYSVAPCVMEMLDYALPENVFHQGLQYYLKKFAYSASDENDLCEALQLVVKNHYASLQRSWNYSMCDIIKSWTHNINHPIVTVRNDYKTNTVHLSQRSTASDKPRFYWIPLNFITSTSSKMPRRSADVFMPPVPEMIVNLSDYNITLNETLDDWLLINNLDKSFYQARYDEDNLHRLIKTLLTRHETIDRHNRAALLRDILPSIPKASEILNALELLKYLRRERNPHVWSAAIIPMKKLWRFLNGTPSTPLLRAFLQRLIKPQYRLYNAKSLKSLNLSESYMFSDIEDFACHIELPECLTAKKEVVLRNMSALLIDDGYELNTYAHDSLCYAAKTFSDDQFQEVLDFYVANSPFSTWTGLKCTNSSEQYQKFLQAVLIVNSTDDIFRQSLPVIRESLMSEFLQHRNAIWQVFDERMPFLIEKIIKRGAIDDFYTNLKQWLQSVPQDNKPKLLELLQRIQPLVVGKADVLLSSAEGGQKAKNPRENESPSAVQKWLEIENNKTEALPFH